LDDLLCRLLQVARPRVVAETFPGFEYILLHGSREGCHGWECRHKPREVVLDGFDLRLL